MASPRDLLPLVLLALLLAPSVVLCGPHHRHHHRRSSSSHQDAVLGWAAGGGECGGTVGECLAGGGVGGEGFDEFEMSSEVSRRILAARRYISYNALRRDSTPCSRRGASYYNCRPGAQANPYSRGCSAITRCRS